MKHIKAVSNTPATAQTSTIEIKMDFLVNLISQVIEYLFQQNGGSY